MAVVYLDRFMLPIGRLKKELIYVNNVVNDDVVRTNLSKAYTVSIRPVNYTGTFTANVSADSSTSGGRDVITIRDPDGVSGTKYEVEVTGQ
jgi:hypothetical protein